MLLIVFHGLRVHANDNDPFLNLVREIEDTRKAGNMALADSLSAELVGLAKQDYPAVFLGDARYQQARNAMERNQYPQAETLLNQAIDIFQSQQDVFRLAKAQRQLGLVHRYLSDYGKALEYLYQALDVFMLHQDEAYLSATYSSLGVVLEKMGLYEPAFENFQQALTINYQRDNVSGIASGLYNLGNIRREMGDLTLSLDYFKDALVLDRQNGNQKDIAYSNNMIALNLMSMGEHQQARGHAEEALSLFQSIEAPRDTDWAITVLADVEYASGNKEKAVEMINGVIARAEKQAYRSLLLDAYETAASFALEEKRFGQAQAHIDSGLQLAKATNELTMQATFTKLLVKLHLESDAYKDAFTALQQQKNLDDEILNAQRINGIAQMQAQSENVRKAHKIALLEKEKALQQATFEQQQLKAQLQTEEKQRQVIELEKDNAQTQLALIMEQRSRQRAFLIFLVMFGILTIIVIVLFHRRKVSELRAQAARQLVERKNRMLSDVSHELRTPLTAIKLQVEMLEYEIADDPKQIYSIVHNKIANLNELINSVFQLAKADSGDLDLAFEQVAVLPWLEGLLQEHSIMLTSHSLRLTSDIKVPKNQSIDCDEARCTQVIENLLSNSCRYTDAGGEVRVSANIDNKTLNIVVEDSAPGVEAEHWPHIFERLYRADESRSRASGGSGLGLSIVKAYVKAHHGRVRASASELGGLKIRIQLPLRQPEGK